MNKESSNYDKATNEYIDNSDSVEFDKADGNMRSVERAPQSTASKTEVQSENVDISSKLSQLESELKDHYGIIQLKEQVSEEEHNPAVRTTFETALEYNDKWAKTETEATRENGILNRQSAERVADRDKSLAKAKEVRVQEFAQKILQERINNVIPWDSVDTMLQENGIAPQTPESDAFMNAWDKEQAEKMYAHIDAGLKEVLYEQEKRLGQLREQAEKRPTKGIEGVLLAEQEKLTELKKKREEFDAIPQAEVSTVDSTPQSDSAELVEEMMSDTGESNIETPETESESEFAEGGVHDVLIEGAVQRIKIQSIDDKGRISYVELNKKNGEPKTNVPLITDADLLRQDIEAYNTKYTNGKKWFQFWK